MARQCGWRRASAVNRATRADRISYIVHTCSVFPSAPRACVSRSPSVVVAPAVVAAQAPLTVERIFSGEFRSDYAGPSRWLDDSTYTIVAPSVGRAGCRPR